MAVCPHCNRKLKLTDIKPECPGCGVNLLFYNNEERLADEAEAAEAQHVAFQRKLDRMKASYIGSPLTIARIILYILPIVSLLLPLFSLRRYDTIRIVNLMTLCTHIENIDLAALTGYFTSGNVYERAYAFALVLFLLSVLLDVLGLLFIAMAGGRFGNVRNLFFTAAALGCAFGSANFLQTFLSSPSAIADYTDGSVTFGTCLYITFLIFCLVINIVIAILGNEVRYTPCLVGGIPSGEYFALIESGASKQEIRDRMKKAIEKIEAENRLKAEAFHQNRKEDAQYEHRFDH